MPKVWDDVMKRIFSARPQDFVSWLLPGAKLVGNTSVELKTKTVTRTITTDTLYRVIINGERAILHVEFQKYPAKNMAQRLWEYNVIRKPPHKFSPFH